MAFNKNRKRVIGILASCLLGLQTSNCEFKDHSYFEPKYCKECNHVYHKGDKNTCSHKKVDASFNRLYLQSNYVGPDGLLWFRHKTDSDKVFFTLLMDLEGNPVTNCEFLRDLQLLDFTLLSLEGIRTNDYDINKFLAASYDNACKQSGTFVDMSKFIVANPLDAFGKLLSEGGYISNMRPELKDIIIESNKIFEPKSQFPVSWEIRHGTDKLIHYPILRSSSELAKLKINKDRTHGIAKLYDLRNDSMVFFSLQDTNIQEGQLSVPTLYEGCYAFYSRKLSSMPLVCITRDIFSRDKKIPGTKLRMFISDGKTANAYLNNKKSDYNSYKGSNATSDGWRIGIHFGTNVMPEVYSPCRIFTIEKKSSRKWIDNDKPNTIRQQDQCNII